jgi:hypothetical protein
LLVHIPTEGRGAVLHIHQPTTNTPSPPLSERKHGLHQPSQPIRPRPRGARHCIACSTSCVGYSIANCMSCSSYGIACRCCCGVDLFTNPVCVSGHHFSFFSSDCNFDLRRSQELWHLSSRDPQAIFKCHQSHLDVTCLNA